jgi:hypothetical protein
MSMTKMGAIIVSVIVLITFGIVLMMVLTKTIPEGSEKFLLIMLGALATMSSNIVQFWVGSSSGSKQKDEVIAAQAKS